VGLDGPFVLVGDFVGGEGGVIGAEDETDKPPRICSNSYNHKTAPLTSASLLAVQPGKRRRSELQRRPGETASIREQAPPQAHRPSKTVGTLPAHKLWRVEDDAAVHRPGIGIN
jgi:hypothetical protein